MAHYKIILSKSANRFGGELGSVAKQRLEISGTANMSTAFLYSANEIESRLAEIFAADGWEIISCNLKSGYIAQGVGLALTANVPGNYSMQEHLDNAYRKFREYKIYNAVFSPFNVFSNVDLKMKGVDTDGREKTIGGTGAPDPKDDDTGFLSTLATTLGISIPLATVGGVLLTILILKR